MSFPNEALTLEMVRMLREHAVDVIRAADYLQELQKQSDQWYGMYKELNEKGKADG